MTAKQTAFKDVFCTTGTGGLGGRALSGPGAGDSPLARPALVLHAQGLAAIERGDGQHAEVLLRQAAALVPEEAVFHYNLGLLLKRQNRPHEAVAAYRRALAADGADADIAYNLGNALVAAGDTAAAVHAFELALALRPDWAFAHLNLASALRDTQSWETAEDLFEKALALAPDDPEIRWNRALFKLQTGDFASGWADYEWRFRRNRASQVYPHGLPFERWKGQRVEHLLVHAEQGLGDTLMFCRYLGLAKERVGRITLEVPLTLAGLMGANHMADRIAVFSPHQAPAGDFDAVVPLMSLAGVFRTGLDTIPAQVPYLRADPLKTALWAAKTPSSGLKVGLMWSGSGTDSRRSLPLQTLAPLARIEGVRLFGLHPDPGPRDKQAMAELAVVDLGQGFGDFGDTAGAMANLDLVVSVDTAAAHLAGAMGIPVVVVLPYSADWRWLIRRPDSPWYPTMTLVRQQRPGCWEEPVVAACALVNARCRVETMPGATGRDQSAGLPENALGIDPGSVEAWYDLGTLCHGRGDHGAAAQAYANALALNPAHAPALNNLGAIFQENGRDDQAEACFKKAVAIDPGLAAAHNNLGKHFQQRGDTQAALAHLERACTADPGFAQAFYNWGTSLLAAGHGRRAVAAFKRAVALRPDFADAFNNLGSALQETGDPAAAAEAFTRALALRPDLAQAHWNLALVRLLLGDYARGFEGYEWRWRKDNHQGVYPHVYPLPPWDGKAFAGKRLYIHDEQGLGDAIQFARFLPLAKALGGTVIFETRSALIPLFKGMAGIDEMVTRRGDGRPATPCDCTAALMSLPRLLKTTLATIPCRVPYVVADCRRRDAWAARLPAGRLRVGLVWAGRPTRTGEAFGLRQRSLSLEHLVPVLSLDTVRFVGLQQDGPAGQVNALDPCLQFDNLGPELADFADTAAVMDQLDLIITVDTAAAHLAGAMARPVWVLLPFAADWRWLTGRSDSPWYPTMRLFRQDRAGTWDAAVREVASALAGWADQAASGKGWQGYGPGSRITANGFDPAIPIGRLETGKWMS